MMARHFGAEGWLRDCRAAVKDRLLAGDKRKGRKRTKVKGHEAYLGKEGPFKWIP